MSHGGARYIEESGVQQMPLPNSRYRCKNWVYLLSLNSSGFCCVESRDKTVYVTQKYNQSINQSQDTYPV
jgi:hypothetical protein